MAQADDDQITIPTPWGGTVAAKGTMVISVLLILAIGWFIYALNRERSAEHDQILNAINYAGCQTRLDIYIHSFTTGETIEFTRMPAELFNCLPRFLVEKASKQ